MKNLRRDIWGRRWTVYYSTALMPMDWPRSHRLFDLLSAEIALEWDVPF